ncbi:MAG: hypothetical protein FJ240_03625 [Nitrospira sp.]|nr:hypothetical protein [Nitrospira sp.]
MTIYAIITFHSTHFALKAKKVLEKSGKPLLIMVSTAESRYNVMRFRFIAYSGTEIDNGKIIKH